MMIYIGETIGVIDYERVIHRSSSLQWRKQKFSFSEPLLNMIQFADERRYYVSKNQQQIQHSWEQFINT